MFAGSSLEPVLGPAEGWTRVRGRTDVSVRHAFPILRSCPRKRASRLCWHSVSAGSPLARGRTEKICAVYPLYSPFVPAKAGIQFFDFLAGAPHRQARRA